MIKTVCPVCHRPIAVSLYRTREGERFSCPRCFSPLIVQRGEPFVLAPLAERGEGGHLAAEELERRSA
ncbi:MAG: hypothetical protein XD60_1788 [Acetothermia bacterium 64_32]|nr:MAG: hypothetical protein XD60_1788 [Acetothermia bacterium 64_32]MBC7098159.1 hypothetical protein [Candidatus Bipolaricaulota bacterium]HAF71442.1 hypothetical protein [Candidatus Acetothermia bacterium]